MAERLTEVGMFIDTPVYKIKNGKKGEAVDKLAKLEDILEKYGIESVEELESILINGLAMLDIQKINILKEMELKTDRDTWKRACELACEEIDCEYMYGINKENYSQYFYQQTKKGWEQ